MGLMDPRKSGKLSEEHTTTVHTTAEEEVKNIVTSPVKQPESKKSTDSESEELLGETLEETESSFTVDPEKKSETEDKEDEFGFARSTETYFRKRPEKILITGLEKLNTAPLPPIGNQERFFPGAILGNRMYVGDKPGGMEPGALLIEINIDLVRTLHEKKVIDATEFLKLEPTPSKTDCIQFVAQEMKRIHQEIDPGYLFEPTRRDETGKELELKLVKFRKQLSKTSSSTPISPTPLQEKKLEKTDSDDSIYADDVDTEYILVEGETPKEEKNTKDEVSHRIENLDQAIKDIRKNAKQGYIPLSLIKQYYNDTTFLGPTPPFYRMKNTNRGKKSSTALVKIWKVTKALKTSRENENQNAISEVFATAVARAYQMPAQNQYVLIGAYKNGKLMITTDADWETRFAPIEKNFAGELPPQQPYSQTCYVDKTKAVSKISNPKYKSELDTLQCASQNLMLMLLQADDDGFGSQLQNKGCFINNNVTELYGIDFGHAYREENDLVDSISLDFTLSSKKLNKYKNFSVLFDSPPTDKMLGLFYTYQILSKKSKKQIGLTEDDEDAIEKAIIDYKQYYQDTYPSFIEKIESIKPGCIELLTNSYIIQLGLKVKALQKELDKSPNFTLENNIDELKHLIHSIREQGIKHIKSSQILIKRFKDRMKHDPRTLELLVNLAKLTSPTTSTSSVKSTGEVELKHLKILHNPGMHVVWNAKHDAKDEDYIHFSATIPKKGNLAEVKKVLTQYFQLTTYLETPLQEKDREISFSIPRENLRDFSEQFSEKNIIKRKPHVTVALHKDYSPAFALAEKLSLLTSVTDEKLNPILDRDRLLTQWSHARLTNGNILMYGKPNDNVSLPKSTLLPLVQHFTDQVSGDKISFTIGHSEFKMFDFGPQQMQFVLTPSQVEELTQKMSAEAIVARKNKSIKKDNLLRLTTDEKVYETMSILMEKLARLTSVTDVGLNFPSDKMYLTQWDFDKLPSGNFLVYGIPNDKKTIHKEHLKDFLYPFTKSLKNPSVEATIAKQESTSAKHQQLQFVITKEQAEHLVNLMTFENIVKIKQDVTDKVHLLRHLNPEGVPISTQKPGFFERTKSFLPSFSSSSTPRKGPHAS